MCIKPERSSPQPGTTFTQGKIATGILLNMIQYVEKEKLHNEVGQSLIWNVIRGSHTFYDCDVAQPLYVSLQKYFATNSLLKFEKCAEIKPQPIQIQTRTLKTYKGTF